MGPRRQRAGTQHVEQPVGLVPSEKIAELARWCVLPLVLRATAAPSGSNLPNTHWLALVGEKTGLRVGD